MPAELITDVQVLTAATRVDAGDLQSTGPRQLGRATRIFQQQLDKRLAATDTYGDRPWRQLLATEVPSATADSFLPELAEKLSNLLGLASMTPCSCGQRPQRDPYPTTTPPQPSGSASSISYRKRRTKTPPPRGSPSDPAHDHDLTRQAAAAAALDATPRSARAAENVHPSQRRTKCFAGPAADPSADQGRLVRGGDWQSGAGHDISVRETARQGGPDNLRGMPLTCAITTYPQGGYTRRRYKCGDASSSRLTAGTCPRSLWRKNDTRRTPRTTTGNPPGGTP